MNSRRVIIFLVFLAVLSNAGAGDTKYKRKQERNQNKQTNPQRQKKELKFDLDFTKGVNTEVVQENDISLILKDP